MMTSAKEKSVTSFLKAIMSLGFASALVAQTYTGFDVPGASVTHPTSINNRGDVSGWFCPIGSSCWFYPFLAPARGFVREFNGNITTFDGIPTSINDAGTVTGYGPQGNFIRDHQGNVTVFNIPPQDYPLVLGGFAVTINNRGEVAGYTVGVLGLEDPYRGFARDKKEDITIFSLSGFGQPTSINARGDITGSTVPFNPRHIQGFVRYANGAITYFAVPDSDGFEPPFPLGINNNGDVTGWYASAVQIRGFVRESNGNITTFDGFPTCINEPADVAGTLLDATGVHTFIRDNKGHTTVFDGGTPTGINDRDDVAGYFSDATGTHGFVRTAH